VAPAVQVIAVPAACGPGNELVRLWSLKGACADARSAGRNKRAARIRVTKRPRWFGIWQSNRWQSALGPSRVQSGAKGERRPRAALADVAPPSCVCSQQTRPCSSTGPIGNAKKSYSSSQS
jgi:hypothetical protein